LDTATGLVYELFDGGAVHVYHVSACSRGEASSYAKYKNGEAKALWAYVCSQAVNLTAPN
jgi:hypothetical protein